MNPSPQVLVVDDDPGIRRAVRRGLAFEGFRVVEASTGEQGLEKARDHHPELVVLDVMLPGIDGLEVARRLRAAGDRVLILMLTARDEVRDRVAGLESGADDYVVKPFSLDELVARIRALLRRPTGPAGETLRFGDLEVAVETHQVRRGARRIELTATEYTLLVLFMRHPETALPRELMLEHVWEMDAADHASVLDTYVRLLRDRLELMGESRLIHPVGPVGYVLRN